MKSAKPLKAGLTIRFNTTLGQSFLVLPKSTNAKLPSRGKTMIEGTINCMPFRAALEPDGKGSHQLKVSKAMREALGIGAVGDMVTLEIARVDDEPETRVPADLRKAFADLPSAQASWMDITPMARRDWIFSITSAKQAKTRARRIEKACDMLASGKRRLCCFPGIKWLMEKNAKSCGMWLPLRTAKKRPLR